MLVIPCSARITTDSGFDVIVEGRAMPGIRVEVTKAYFPVSRAPIRLSEREVSAAADALLDSSRHESDPGETT